MLKSHTKTYTCAICNKSKKLSELYPLQMVRDPIIEIIQKDHPNLPKTGYICSDDLNKYRVKFIKKALEDEKGELSVLEEDVVRSIKEQETISKDTDAEYERHISFADKLSDRLADYGGSWKFIISFIGILIIWIAFNSTALFFRKAFDPFPFILLNLVLSCLAAIQAPIILMSQNRQEAKDRLRSEYDYRVNLKAELEIRHLHQKLDYFLEKEWQTLLQIQQIQTELMKELYEKKEKKK
jgi:uncharacterized membrane protein